MQNIERFLAHCSDEEKQRLIEMLHESLESKGEEKEEHDEGQGEEEEEDKNRPSFKKDNKKPEYMK